MERAQSVAAPSRLALITDPLRASSQNRPLALTANFVGYPIEISTAGAAAPSVSVEICPDAATDQ